MLTVEKKRGRKQAMFPKARLGVIIGIEDNMPAYRVYDFELKCTHKIPLLKWSPRQREWDLYVTLSVDFCEYVMYRSHCGHR